MSTFISGVKAFMNDENGVTAIEYGLIAALVGVGIAVAAKGLGTELNLVFTNITGKLADALK